MIAIQERTSASVLEHLCNAINAVEVCDWPYAHFYLGKAFPTRVFKQMLELLPAASDYGADNPRIHTREDGLVTRNILSLSPPTLAQLPPAKRSFWNEIATALTAPELRHVVFRKLSGDLTRRFRKPADQLHTV